MVISHHDSNCHDRLCTVQWLRCTKWDLCTLLAPTHCYIDQPKLLEKYPNFTQACIHSRNRSLQNANRSQNFEYQKWISIANQSRCSKNNNIVCLSILTLWYVQTGPVEVVGSLPKSHAAHPRSSPSKVSQVTSVAATVSVPGQLVNSSYDLMAKHSSAYHSQNRQKSSYSNSPQENSPRKGSNTSVAEALGKVEAEEKAEE